MSDPALALYVHARTSLSTAQQLVQQRLSRLPERLDERGEGVISAAIAVLVMAFLGALMWVAFKAVFTGATTRTKDQVDLIGG